jgi:zinc protease
MGGRFEAGYYAADSLSDVLSRGQSSRLYHQLVKEKEIFTSISSFVMGTLDPGLLVISGRVRDGVSLEDAEREVNKILKEVVEHGVTEAELEKVKNQAVSTIEFGEVEVSNRAMALAFAALSGDTNVVNTEKEELEAVTVNDVHEAAKNILREVNSSVLYYTSAKQELQT